MESPKPLGTSIRIYLADGEADGVWVVEKSNWTGKALMAPRTRYRDLRARPDLERGCVEAMDDAIHGVEGIHLIRGKMVIEAKADTSDKGGAIRDFLSEPPFARRTPFFAGDDVTDEDAFAVVNSRQGISVKVGPGQTLARYRANSTPVFLDWLRCVGDDLERAQAVEQS